MSLVRIDDARRTVAADIVVNATSIGLFPDVDARIALNTDTLTSNMIVADVIPNPPKTRLVREATEKGCQVIDGLGMLVAQGVITLRALSEPAAAIPPQPSLRYETGVEIRVILGNGTDRRTLAAVEAEAYLGVYYLSFRIEHLVCYIPSIIG